MHSISMRQVLSMEGVDASHCDGLLGPATLRIRAALRTAGTSVSRRSPGHSTFSAVTKGIRLTLGLARRARLRRFRMRSRASCGREAVTYLSGSRFAEARGSG